MPQRAEAVPPAAEPTQTPVPPPAQAQTPSTPTPATPATTSNELDQLSAADTDVIEKAWVDKAEKIIEQNQDNPYTEEDQEEKLSQDYQKKRFNIDVNDG